MLFSPIHPQSTMFECSKNVLPTFLSLHTSGAEFIVEEKDELQKEMKVKDECGKDLI